MPMFTWILVAFRRRTCSSTFLACQRSPAKRSSAATGPAQACATSRKRSTPSGHCHCRRRQSGAFSAKWRLASGQIEGKRNSSVVLDGIGDCSGKLLAVSHTGKLEAPAEDWLRQLAVAPFFLTHITRACDSHH